MKNIYMVQIQIRSTYICTHIYACIYVCIYIGLPSLVGQLVKNLPGDLGWTPGLGRSPGEGSGNPLQYSCLESSMDGGAW